jgi:hypothetical protein
MTDISKEYQTMLRQLRDETHPPRQPGDFTIEEYFEANKERVSSTRKAADELSYMFSIGAVEKPPKRFIDRHLRVVYRLIPTKPPKQ